MAESYKSKLKEYWYCKEDSYGQRTGEIEKILLTPDEIKTDTGGLIYHKGKFLFGCQLQALRAAFD